MADEVASMTDALLPCPFCGGAAERINIEEKGVNFGGSCIACKRCDASSSVHFNFKENLDDSWNRRADSPEIAALKARVGELEGVLGQITRSANHLHAKQIAKQALPPDTATG